MTMAGFAVIALERLSGLLKGIEVAHESKIPRRLSYCRRIGFSGFCAQVLHRSKHENPQVLGPSKEAQGKNGCTRERRHFVQVQKRGSRRS
jgi:hypothetical protein